VSKILGDFHEELGDMKMEDIGTFLNRYKILDGSQEDTLQKLRAGESGIVLIENRNASTT
jgi:hypothetical protein